MTASRVLGLVILLAGVLLTQPTLVGAQSAVYAATNPDSAAGLAHHALECLHRGEDALTNQSKLAAYREGLQFAERAVAVDDRNASAHFAIFANSGRIQLIEGVTPNPLTLASASRELDRALELDPDQADALAAKGGMYRQLPRLLGGSLTMAETYLTRAISADPKAVGARIELAETYRDMGCPERGVPLLEKAAQVAEQEGKYRQLTEARSLLHELRPTP